MKQGYLSKEYGKSFQEIERIEYSGAYLRTDWCPTISEAKISYILTNPYPFFIPERFNISVLWGDIDYLSTKNRCVGLSLFTDPLLEDKIKENALAGIFDKIEPYKDNYIINLQTEIKLAHGHWDKIRRFSKTGASIKNVTLVNTVNRVEYAKVFYEIYKTERSGKSINPILDFSEESIIKQFQVPGIVVFTCEYENDIKGIMVFYLQGENVYLHLTAYRNHDLSCSYALMYEAYHFFKQLGMDRIVLGNDIEAVNDKKSLLDWKKGFANDIKKSFYLEKNFK